MIALYARKSVSNINSVSCQTQLDYCRSALKPEEKSEKIITFVDDGFSGGNLNRDGYIRMMKLVKKGKISKVVVYRLDRISRSLVDFLEIMQTLKQHKVEFVSSQESFDTASPYGELIVRILAVFAEFERQSIIERVTQAYAHRSELGLYMGGRVPYGFSLEEATIHGIKTKILVPTAEIEHVRFMFDTYSIGGVSLRRVMDNLIKEGLQPPDGGRWSTAKISTILRNPIYVRADASVYEYFSRLNANIVSDISEFDGTHGIQLYGQSKHKADDLSDMKVIVMHHEGIVSSDVWLNCQRKLEGNKQINNSMSNTTSWLGGKLICSTCHKKLTVTKGGKRADGTSLRYFNCTGRSNRSCKGTKVTLYADSLEAMADEMIAEKLATLKNCRRQVSSDNTGRLNLLKGKLLEIKAAQERLADLVMKDGLETDMLAILNAKAKKLAEEKREVSEKIEAIEAAESEVVNVINLVKEWEKASYDEKKAVVNLLIDKIIISEDGSVEVVWNI